VGDLVVIAPGWFGGGPQTITESGEEKKKEATLETNRSSENMRRRVVNGGELWMYTLMAEKKLSPVTSTFKTVGFKNNAPL
jgi:hypothetical protein